MTEAGLRPVAVLGRDPADFCDLAGAATLPVAFSLFADCETQYADLTASAASCLFSGIDFASDGAFFSLSCFDFPSSDGAFFSLSYFFSLC